MAAVAAPSSNQLYQHALHLLQQQKFELAFVAAKRALDGATPNNNSSSSAKHQHGSQLLHCAQCWLALAAAAAGMGDTEVAYSLYAKGYKHCHTAMRAGHGGFTGALSSKQQQQQQQELSDLVQELSAGRLNMLAALCEVPQHWQQQQQQLGHGQQLLLPSGSTTSNGSSSKHMELLGGPGTAADAAAAKANGSSSSAHQVGMKLQQQQQQCCKRLQRMHDRFQLDTCSSSSSSSPRVFCVSDLHVDQAGGANLAWLKRISSTAFRNDVVIVAGDVGDTVAAVHAAFHELAPRFRRVVWLPGNHEAWLRPGSRDVPLHPDSFAKLLALRQLADEVGVDVGPLEVSPGLLLVPLMSWYNTAFDEAEPRPGRYRHDSFCSWPVVDDDVWQVMMRLNAPTLALVSSRIAGITQQQQQQVGQTPGHQQQQQQQQQGQHTGPAASVPDSSSSSSSSSSSAAGGGSGGRSSVAWNTHGVLAVKSGKKVPGLQINIKPRATTKQTAPQQLAAAAAPAINHHHHHQQQQQQHDAAGRLQLQPLQAQEGQRRSTAAGNQQSAQLPQPVTAAAAAAPVIQASAQTQTAVAGPPTRFTPPPPAAPAPLAPAAATASVPPGITVITVSHFLPHRALPHSHVSELAKAMGCCELQLQMEQVWSAVHVYGHSHINTDVTLPTPPVALSSHGACVTDSNSSMLALKPGSKNSSSSSSSSSASIMKPGKRRYVQYALEAIGPSAGLYCLWDGQALTPPGCVVSLAGP